MSPHRSMTDNEIFNPFSTDIGTELSKVLVGRVVSWGNEAP